MMGAVKDNIVYSVNGEDLWTDDFQDVLEEVMDNAVWTNPDVSNLDEEQLQQFVIDNCTYFTGLKKEPSRLIDSNDIIDALIDRGCDSGGEWACDYPDVPPEGINELDQFMKQWYEKYAKPNWFDVDKVVEHKFEQGDFE